MLCFEEDFVNFYNNTFVNVNDFPDLWTTSVFCASD